MLWIWIASVFFNVTSLLVKYAVSFYMFISCNLVFLFGRNMSGYENIVGGKLKLKGKALDVKGGGVKKKKKKKHNYEIDSRTENQELTEGWFFLLLFFCSLEKYFIRLFCPTLAFHEMQFVVWCLLKSTLFEKGCNNFVRLLMLSFYFCTQVGVLDYQLIQLNPSLKPRSLGKKEKPHQWMITWLQQKGDILNRGRGLMRKSWRRHRTSRTVIASRISISIWQISVSIMTFQRLVQVNYMILSWANYWLRMVIGNTSTII